MTTELRVWLDEPIATLPTDDGGQRQLLADLWVPQNLPARPKVVVYIHGGGWQGGTQYRPPFQPRLYDQGIAVIAITYRFSGEAIWPAQIHDCKLAVRWTRANADRFGLDTQRIAVWGISAGGHLVDLMGCTNGNPDYEDDGLFAEQSSDVCAVVDMCGPTDFVRTAGDPVPGETMIELSSKLFGEPLHEQLEAARHASPLHQAHAGAVPHLIVHGEADPIVPAYHATDYHERLRELGVESELIVTPDVGHSIEAVPENAPRIAAFLTKHLEGTTSK